MRPSSAGGGPKKLGPPKDFPSAALKNAEKRAQDTSRLSSARSPKVQPGSDSFDEGEEKLTSAIKEKFKVASGGTPISRPKVHAESPGSSEFSIPCSKELRTKPGPQLDRESGFLPVKGKDELDEEFNGKETQNPGQDLLSQQAVLPLREKKGNN